MIRKGSLVRFTGKDRLIPPGKYLSVHDVSDRGVVVWVDTGKWTRRTVKRADVEEVVE